MATTPTARPAGTGSRDGGRTVLVILHGESVGGASLSVLRVVPLLEKRGWRFVFWAPRPSPLFEELLARGLDAHGEPRGLGGYSLRALRVPPGPRARLARVPRYVRSLRSLLRTVRPDLVHANSLYAFAEAGVARAAGFPTVLHVHEMVRPNLKGRIAKHLAHAIHTEVIGVSQACSAALSTSRHRARIVHEAAPVPAEPPERDPAPARTVVGTIGVIAKRKGTDVFVEAARLVREATDQVELRIVGDLDDPLDAAWGEAVLARARALGIIHRPRADVEAELAGWDVFALPSRIDPFPIVVLEAMGSALPVVGTAVDGIPEQVTPETGILVPDGDARGLAEAILELHADPERRGRLGRAGRRRVIESFGLERQAAELDRAYLEALGEPATGAGAPGRTARRR